MEERFYAKFERGPFLINLVLSPADQGRNRGYAEKCQDPQALPYRAILSGILH